MVHVGKIARFDEVRGYGFITPDEGGPDVFVHVNDLNDDKTLITTGTSVEYELIDGERGLKAFDVSVIGDRAPAAGGGRVHPSDDEVLCDVLTTTELRIELTELILDTVPELSGAHLVRLRESLLTFARKHGWSED
ncbi:cold-shock DNA-binding protein family [Actinomadura meyerae]|uniref:Cold-shock DNA-binding protein family n=1 Tax=Actinomadura meyerae TaxID=240840 RepID=A0A239L1B2_9ACTN|nr:cold shock domain-containing protein [Actinomadura meyerae]SNT24356.1 cold-shock DNA-binding protein family [Actinomadura meyerae]